MAMARFVQKKRAESWLAALLHSSSVNLSAQPLVVKDNIFTRYNSPAPSNFDHTAILAAPATKVTVLPNGLRIATESHLSMQTASLGVWIDAGSRFESALTNGTAHFLEHMIFKGTKKRSTRQLEEEVETRGAHLNAYTSREQTTYFAKVLKGDVNFAMDLLADIIQNSAFTKDRIERERSVILREMKEVEGQTEEVIFDHLHATAFQHTPLGRTVLGSVENIKSITRDDLVQYIRTHYTAPRMVIAGAGALDHKEIVQLTEKLFTNLSTYPTSVTELIKKDRTTFTGSEVRLRDDDMPLAHFAVAVMGASWMDPDSTALMVMHTMLGGWNKASGAGKHMGSELAQKVAANELAESYMAFNTHYNDAGLFGVYAVAKPDKLFDLSWAIMHEIGRLIYGVSEEDVIRARNQLKSCFLLHLDGTGAIAEDIGRQLLTYGRRMPLAELFARIDAVDAAAVKRVAQRFIHDKEVALAAMGPIQDLPDYNWFRRRTYWLRY